ncbi:MAG TPA: TldD/PmbA family protein [Elusimicrobiales bacterium]|nr:TldD/PmbA family protein [Elusimicrobiales bacterium]
MNKVKTIIEKILKTPVTDHVTICYGRNETQHIRFSNNSVNRENLFKLEEEVKVEVGYEGRTGSYRTNELSEAGIKHAVNQAYEAAKLLPKDPEYMPPVTRKEAAAVKNFKPAFEKVPDGSKYAILRDAFKQLKKAGLNSAGSLSTSPYTTEVYNSSGVRASHSGCTSSFTLTAMTENSSFRDSFISKDFSGYDGKAFISKIIDHTRLSKDPAPLDAGKYTVVLGPSAVEELLLMLLWYNMDAKAIDEGRSALSARRGRRIAHEKIHIYSKPDHPVSLTPFCPEDGMPYIGFDMIRNGRLASPWHSRYYAAKKGVRPTGRFPGSVIFKGTDKPVEKLIAGVENGLYVNSFWYIRLVDLMDGIFTGMTRDGLFRIQDGKLTGSVNNFRFNQSVFDMLLNTTEIGREKGMVFTSIPPITVKEFNFVSKTEF